MSVAPSRKEYGERGEPLISCQQSKKEDALSEARHFDDYYRDSAKNPEDQQEVNIWAKRALNPSRLPLDYWEYTFYLAGDIRGKRVLEIGCGGGWITRMLALKGARVSACDVSLEGCRLTRRKLDAWDLAMKLLPSWTPTASAGPTIHLTWCLLRACFTTSTSGKYRTKSIGFSDPPGGLFSTSP